MIDHGWKHDDLAADLAQYLRSDTRMVWTDMQLGPSGSARPDVYTLEKSYSKPLPTAYECKISRSDFRSDTTSGKWQKYLAYAGAVVFAIPDGLCTPAEIPTGCGLIVRKDKVWRNVRRATRHACQLPMDAFMKLLIDGVNRTVQQHIPRPRSAELWREHEGFRKKFGEAVARAARDIAAAETDAAALAAARADRWARVDREVDEHRQYRMTQAQSEMAQFEAAKRDLIAWLGLDEGISTLTVNRKIAELRAECDADQRCQASERVVSRVRQSVEQALRHFPAKDDDQ